MSDLRSRAAASGRTIGEQAEVDGLLHRVTDGPPVVESANLPDVANSGIVAELDVPVHVAWSRVMGEVQWIAKARRADKFNYRGIDDVVDAVAPAIRKHGVVVMPVKVAPEYTVIHTTKGSAMNYCRAVVAFAIIGPRGETLSAPNDAGVMVPLLGEAVGEGFDTGDKSSMKAQSVAMREFLIKALAIPVNRPASDPEHGEQYQIAGPKAPSAEEYAAEIVDQGTSLDRLRQIKAELFANRAIGSAEVEPFGYEKMRLVDLVQQVGRARAGGGRHE